MADFIVKYNYRVSAYGWKYPSYRRFKTQEEAYEWIRTARREIMGFDLVYIQKDCEFNIPAGAGGGSTIYEGSTDAQILGMRY